MRRMIGVAEADRLIFARMPELRAIQVPLVEAPGRILGQKIVAERDHPPFDRVMMDGIALGTEGLAKGKRDFKIAGIQAAGTAPLTLPSIDCCIEVMTGAVLPLGCNAVVPVEQIEVEEMVARIAPDLAIEPGQFIHAVGSDRRAGSALLAPGRRLDGPCVAVLASEGYARVEVAACPRICVIATGNELVEVASKPQPHQIRLSNAPAIAAGLNLHGWDAVTVRHLVDDREVLEREFESLLENHDILILSGGVSKGRYDYVPEVLAALGIAADFHGIRQRPGKPMWFGGREQDGKIVFALPGNPVSSLVCLHRYVLPALLKAAGGNPGRISVRLGEIFRFKSELTGFVPVRLVQDESGETVASARSTHNSGDFAALAMSDGFVELPEESESFAAGFCAGFYPWQV
ncbi:MAG: molybdopterin molybdotransferase MoeA [Gammaproteobacteria bacterium]|nr:molybdopterin molybdotransferase MoeA [Gammaproteobacteria bacterium]